MTDQLRYISIPVPMAMPLNRGPYAVDSHVDAAIHIKFGKVHQASITAAAKACQVPITTFIRWCAIMTAQQVLEENFRDGEGKSIGFYNDSGELIE